MKKVLAIAPHPDDETLGCGGTLLRHHLNGDEVHWLILTAVSEARGFSAARVQSRAAEIDAVASAYGFAGVHKADFPTAMLDTLPKGDLIGAVGQVVKSVGAEVLYVPHRYDVHSDHAAVFDAAAACSKSFRYPTVKSVYAYETLSETEFGLRPDGGFHPNLFVDIDGFLDRKLEIMKMFAGEMGPFPFPRSEECIRALATLRGSVAGVSAAEAFMILKEIR